jgi:hypothetical protein
MSLNLGDRFRYDIPYLNLVFETNSVSSATIWLVGDGEYHVLPIVRSGETFMAIPINFLSRTFGLESSPRYYLLLTPQGQQWSGI